MRHRFLAKNPNPQVAGYRHVERAALDARWVKSPKRLISRNARRKKALALLIPYLGQPALWAGCGFNSATPQDPIEIVVDPFDLATKFQIEVGIDIAAVEAK